MKVRNSGERIFMVSPGLMLSPGETVEVQDELAQRLASAYPELQLQAEPKKRKKTEKES